LNARTVSGGAVDGEDGSTSAAGGDVGRPMPAATAFIGRILPVADWL